MCTVIKRLSAFDPTTLQSLSRCWRARQPSGHPPCCPCSEASSTASARHHSRSDAPVRRLRSWRSRATPGHESSAGTLPANPSPALDSRTSSRADLIRYSVLESSCRIALRLNPASTRSKLHVFGRRHHKARPFKVDLGHTGVSEHVRSGSMSKYAVLASLIAAAQTAIFLACHVALINSGQADNSGVVSEACLVLQHIAECHSWRGREWWSYHRYCDWSLHPLARMPSSVTPHSL